ncbi:MAG: hypothetical protein HN712_18230 [Gemmatimonadetes bacterium]|nr:hypothetical protein [Gemmatimonadota bacterium]MBT7862262.1 hypothetical protein [Gemmatimonadota bacterium]
MLRRHPTLLIPLILVGLYVLLRLPPAQDLLTVVVEDQLSDAVGATVDISRLRTNLWDEVSIHHVQWDSSDGAVRSLSLDSLQLQWTGGPPWSGRPGLVKIHGLDLQLPTPDGAGAAPTDDMDGLDKALDAIGEIGELRGWIPDLAWIEDVQITVGDSSSIVAQLNGALSIRHAGLADMDASDLGDDDDDWEELSAPVRIEFSTQSATILLPYGSRHWDTNILGELLVGSTWAHLDGSFGTSAHHAMVEAYLETGRTTSGTPGAERPVFDIQAWLGLTEEALADVSRLDSVLSLSSLRLDLAAHGHAATAVAHVDVDARQILLSGIPIDHALASAHAVSDGALYLDSLVVVGPAGAVHGSGQANWVSPYPVDLQVDATAMDLATLQGWTAGADSSLRGHADLQLRIRGDLEQPVMVSARAQGQEIRVGSLDLGEPDLRLKYERPVVQAALQSRFGTLRVHGDITGSDAHDLTWSIPALSLDTLHHVGGIEPITGTGQVEVNSSGALARPQIAARVQVDDIRLGALRVPPFLLTTTIDSTGPVQIQAAAGDLVLEAVGDWPSRQLTRASLRLPEAPLGGWLARPWAQEWSGLLHVDLKAGGDLYQPRIDGRVGISGLGLRGRDFGNVDWSMTLQEGTANVHMAALDSTARLSGRLSLDEGLPFRLLGQLDDIQLSPFLELLTDESILYDGHVQAALNVRGSVADLDRTRVNLTLDRFDITSPTGTLALVGRSQATWQDETLSLDSLRLAGSAGAMVVTGKAVRSGPVTLQYELQRLSLPYVATFIDVGSSDMAGDLNGFLRVSGTLAEPQIKGGIGVDELRLGSTTVGQLSARFSSEQGLGRLDQLQLHLPGGGSLRGSAAFPLDLGVHRLEDRSVHAVVRVDSVMLDREQGLPEGVAITLDGQINARNTSLVSDSLEVVLKADRVGVRTGQYVARNQEPLHLIWRRGHVRSARSTFVVADTLPPADSTVTRVDSVVLHGNSDSAEGLRLHTDQIDLGVLARMLGVERPVQGDGAAQASWHGAWPEARIDVRVAMEAGLVDSVQIDALLIEGVYDVEGLRLDTLDAHAAGGTLRGAGFLTADSLRIAMDVRDLELAPLRHSVGYAGTDVTGRLQGNVRISGPRASPVWEMEAVILDGVLDVPSFEPALRFATAQILLTPDTLLIAGLEDRDGRWSLEAHAQIDSGRATHFSAGMQLNQLRVVLPETMDLTVDGSLLWEGEADSSAVTGSVLIEPAHLIERMSLRTLAFADSMANDLEDTAPDTSSTAALQAVRLAIDLTGRRMLLDNELARVPFDAELVIGGTAYRPTLRGGLRASEGTVFYVGQEFEVSRTRFEFAEARPLDDVRILFHDPVRLDPTIDFLATTELKAKNGNEYDIHLGLGGSLANLQVTLTSDPAEEQVDILSLLNFGRTGVPMVDARGGMLSTGVNLSPNYLLAATEAQFGRVLGLDNVEIDNSVLKPGRLAGSRIVLTKQLGKRTEMIYSTTVGYASQGRVQLQYDLGNHLYLQTQHDARGESGIDLNLKLSFK